MLTILEFAKIAKDVYQEPPPILLSAQLIANIQKNKNGQYIQSQDKKALDGFYHMNDVDPIQHPTNPFYTQLYIKFVDGKPVDSVVALRGTDNWKNKIVDVESWWQDGVFEKFRKEYVPNYADPAAIFYMKSRQYLRDNFPEIANKWTYVTGHSLGGALAALITVRCAFPSLAITFNSPGIAEMPNIHQDLFGRVYNIQARYDFISKLGKQCRPAIYVEVPQKVNEAKAAFEHSARASQLEDAIANNSNFFVASGQQAEAQGNEELAAAEFRESAIAQHSMYNLWNALSDSVNSAVAHKIPA